MSVLVCILLALSALAMIFMPFLVETVIAARFDPASEKFELTVTMTRIMFPYLMAMSLVAMFSGILNSLRRYFLAALAPVLLNVAMIAALGLAWLNGADPRGIGLWLSWSVIVSGVLQLLLLVEGVRRQGFGLSLRAPAFTPSVRRLLWLALPAAVTGGITQINLLVGQNIASAQDGAIAVINYADRLFQLPLGIITNAIGVVLLAELARTLRAGNLDDACTCRTAASNSASDLSCRRWSAFSSCPKPCWRWSTNAARSAAKRRCCRRASCRALRPDCPRSR